MQPTGTHIAYYLICKRKLWFFARGLECEHDSDLVAAGRLLHETTYKRKQKELGIGPVKMDWIDKSRMVIHEVKKSDKMEESHEMQLKYYLYYMWEIGAGEFSGELNYPKLHKTKSVTLEENDANEIKAMIEDIQAISESDTPPAVKTSMRICKKCSYYELCRI